MEYNEQKGKRQHIATRKSAATKRFSDEEIEQHERIRDSWVPRRDGDSDRPARRFNHDNNSNHTDDGRPRRRSSDRPADRDRKFSDRPHRRSDDEKPFDCERKFDRRPSRDGDSEKPFGRDRKFGDRPRRRSDDEKPFSRERKFDRKPFGEGDSERPFGHDKFEKKPRRTFGDKPFDKEKFDRRPRRDNDEERPYSRGNKFGSRRERNFDDEEEQPRTGRRGYRREKDERYDRPKATGEIRLNKYLADSGICSRREADDLILAGCVTVNDVVVTELGTKVKPSDKVVYGGQTLSREKLCYVLLNKPKGVITTSDDPYERHTVMDLVEGACDERIYPVGRLDRNTLGLLLLTNDGELAKTLTHPSHEVKKLYQVTLNKPLTKNDLDAIREGIELEDGPIKVDEIQWVADDLTKREVGVEIHSGRNHIVRRIFEHFGYEVVKLDRVMFAGLTKYMLPRGHWRFLTPAEINMLKSIK